MKEVIYAALWQLDYPTTKYWLEVARGLYRDGVSAEQLAARLKNLDIKPTRGGGEGSAVDAKGQAT